MKFVIFDTGFEKPSAIQQRSILPIVKGRDVIAQAQSGKRCIFYENIINVNYTNPTSCYRCIKMMFLYCIYKGTGKTATFSISILQSLDTTLRETQVLCLSPTRELAVQIQKVILALGDFMNVQCHAVNFFLNLIK